MSPLPLAIIIWSLNANASAATPATQPAMPGASDYAAVTCLAEPVLTREELAVPSRPEPVTCWLRRPRGHGPGQDAPLLIALHGTDDTAGQMVDFWAARAARVPMVIAACQASGRGWSSIDLPALRAVIAHLRGHVSFDPDRVLLAGFSAGGAMSYYLLYKEKVPATAVAALACYVPPQITDDEIRARGSVPVFYAVGMDDVNHERMRDRIERLRLAGGNVTLHRPRIGHVLNAEVGQAALDWFFDKCAARLDAIVHDAREKPGRNAAAAELERIVTQSRWHEPILVQQATAALAQLEAPGQREIEAARKLVAASRPADAVEALRKIEMSAATGRLARQAAALRLELTADPRVRCKLDAREAQQRAAAAMNLYAGAQRLVARGRLPQAAEQCRLVIRLYDETPAAERARNLLEMLEKRGIH